MSKFLTQEEVYRILQRELPEGIYPDGAPSQYLSTSENDSVAKCIGSVYTTMSSIADNLNLLTATEERMGAWETTVFGETLTTGLSLEDRRRLVIAKLRSSDDISVWQLTQTIAGVVKGDAYFEVRQRNTQNDTYGAQIKGANADEVWGPTWTSGDPAPSGVTVTDDVRNTEATLLTIRTHVYTYDVVIWNYWLDISLLTAQLDGLLTRLEPARSAHTFTQIASEEGFFYDMPATRENYTGVDGWVLHQDTSSDSGLSRYAWYFGFDTDPSAIGFADIYDPGEERTTFAPPLNFDGDFDGKGFGDSSDTTLGGYFANSYLVGGSWYFLI